MAAEVRFVDPPVQEASLTIWYEPLRTLNALHLAKLRLDWIEEFPNVEEKAPLAPWKSSEDGVSFVDFEAKWPMPACIFSNSTRDREVLVQDDRFSLSWQSIEEQAYPGFGSLFPDIAKRYSDFVSAIGASANPEPIARRATIEYENFLEGVDPHEASVRILTDRKISLERSARGRQFTSIRRHFHGIPGYEDVNIVVGIDPASISPAAQEGSTSDVVVTRLVVNAASVVDKGQDPTDRLRRAHDAAISLFLSLFESDARSVWGEV